SQDRNRANVRIDLHGVQPSGFGTIPADWQRQYEILTKVKPTLRMPAGKNSTESEAFQFTTQEARDTQGSEMSLQFDKSFKECRWREQVLPIYQELARELELMPSVPYRVNICTADRYIAVSIHDDNESPYRLFLCERNGNQLWKTVVVPFECSPW